MKNAKPVVHAALTAVAALSTLLGAPARAVTLVHTNDVLGELEPCGCRNNPLGGMVRKANLLKKNNDPSLIQVDAGDLLFPTDVVPPLLEGQSKLQAEYLLKSMDMLHHDAVVPGEKDFGLGVKVLEELKKKTPIHFLAANLKRKNGKKLFEDHVILTRKTSDGKTLKVGIFGLVGESLNWPKELKSSPAIPAARREVQALRKKVDVLVALTHEGWDKDEALAKAVPGIDMIIGGHTQAFLQNPPTVGKTKIFQSSFRNQYVGLIPLQKPFTGEGYQLVALDPGYDSPSQAPSAMDDLVKEFKTAVAELNSREEERMLAQASAGDPSSASKASKFQTFPKCAECHLKQFDFWRKTHHAMALAPLIEKQESKNKECLQCHTVGLGDPEGFSTVGHLAEAQKGDEPSQPIETEQLNSYLKAMHDASSLESSVPIPAKDGESRSLRLSLSALHRSWTPVQCENCHQPGRDHPFSSGYSKKVETTTCLKCHTPERAPEWYTQAGQPDAKVIESKRAQVTCPAGD